MINSKILRILFNRFVLIYGDLFYFLFKTPFSSLFHHSFSSKLLRSSLNKQSTFLISSERGLYLFSLRLNRVVSLVRGYIFGFAINPKHAFIAISSSRESSIYSFDIYNPKKRFKRPRLIYKQHALYHGERIHQLSTHNTYLFVADTYFNAITVLNVDSPQKAPFSVHPYVSVSGSFVNRDVNHINSIQVFSNAIIFTAHNGGSNNSHIGLIFEDSVSIYLYKNRGCHDIIFDNLDLLVSDSFGCFVPGKEELPGIVTPEGKITLDANFVRGLLKAGNNLVSCSSFHGNRNQRFTGSSHMYYVDRLARSVRHVHTFNFSQIHDITFLDGSRSDSIVPRVLDICKAQQLLNSLFSDPISTHKYIVTIGGTAAPSIRNIFDYTSAFSD